MMKAMGWSGGGLGTEGEGRTEPVLVKHRFDNDRRGLGLPPGKKKMKAPQQGGGAEGKVLTQGSELLHTGSLF